MSIKVQYDPAYVRKLVDETADKINGQINALTAMIGDVPDVKEKISKLEAIQKSLRSKKFSVVELESAIEDAENMTSEMWEICEKLGSKYRPAYRAVKAGLLGSLKRLQKFIE